MLDKGKIGIGILLLSIPSHSFHDLLLIPFFLRLLCHFASFLLWNCFNSFHFKEWHRLNWSVFSPNFWPASFTPCSIFSPVDCWCPSPTPSTPSRRWRIASPSFSTVLPALSSVKYHLSVNHCKTPTDSCARLLGCPNALVNGWANSFTTLANVLAQFFNLFLCNGQSLSIPYCSGTYSIGFPSFLPPECPHQRSGLPYPDFGEHFHRPPPLSGQQILLEKTLKYLTIF